MEDSIIKWGNDVKSAVTLALEEMNLTEDDVTIEVLEEPSKGFLGIGAKLAKVQVTRKVPLPKPEPKEKPKAKPQVRPNRPEPQKAAGGKGGRERNSDRKNKPSGNREKRESRLPVEEEPLEPIVDMSTLTDLPEDHEGLVFIKSIIEGMNVEVSVQGKTSGEDLYFFIDGKDSGTIIGKRGATLDALQYLVSLKVNKGESEYIRVVVDAENYRAKRERSLEKLAHRLADKVVKSRRSFKLEPMNPYERKVIHATLQKDGRVTTRSEGQDPSRRVIIELK